MEVPLQGGTQMAENGERLVASWFLACVGSV